MVASWVTISRLRIIIPLSSYEEDIIWTLCFQFLTCLSDNNEIGRGFPPTSDQIPPTPGSSDWPNWDPHMVLYGVQRMLPANGASRLVVRWGRANTKLSKLRTLS